jgi:hypothetical protein
MNYGTWSLLSIMTVSKLFVANCVCWLLGIMVLYEATNFKLEC